VPGLLIRGTRPPSLWGDAEPTDVLIRDGAIQAVGPVAGPVDAIVIEAEGGMLSPAFVEAHWHADKYASVTAHGAPGGPGVERVRLLRERYTPDDVAERAERGMRTALAWGVTRMRVTVDVSPAIGMVALEGVLTAREALGGLLDVQICVLPEGASLLDPATAGLVDEAFWQGAEVVGAYPNGAAAHAEGLAELDAAFALAERFGVPIDVHVDEGDEPGEVMLEALAERVLDRGWGERALADHAVALESYEPAHRDRVIDRVARAGLPICVMPNNLAWDPAARGGLAMVPRLRAAGVTVAAGTDNANDGYLAFGNLDPVERAFLVAHGGAIEGDEAALVAWETVTSGAARAIGAVPGALEPGAPADLVLFDAPGIVSALRRLPGRRTVIRAGRVVAGVEAAAWTEGER
jgi:cytosine deaminase